MTGMLVNCLCVGAGGFVGAVTRYVLGLLPAGLQAQQSLGGFPLTTFLVNVVGAFAIGFIMAAATHDTNLSPELVLFLKVGLCGGFTTFSTFSLESLQLLQEGQWVVAAAYMMLSVVVCVAAVLAGSVAGSCAALGGD